MTTEIVTPPGSFEILRVELSAAYMPVGKRRELSIVIEPPEYVLGLSTWPTRIAADNTETPWSLRKFARSLSDNPVAIVALYSPVVHSTPAGDELRATAPRFASKRTADAMGYYAEYYASRARREDASITTLVEAFITGVLAYEYITHKTIQIPPDPLNSQFASNIANGTHTHADVDRLVQDRLHLIEVALERFQGCLEPDHDAIDRLLVQTYRAVWDRNRGRRAAGPSDYVRM